jgi:hypothetical protein
VGVAALGCNGGHEERTAVSAARLTSTTVDAPAAPDELPTATTPTTHAVLIPDAPPERPRPVAVPPMSEWGARYPGAARLFAEWSEAHPQGSQDLAEWAKAHPEEMENLVDWATTNVGDDVDVLFLGRSSWRQLRRIANEDRAAVQGLLLWIRSAPPAASELAAHPEGMAFATQHLRELRHENRVEPAAAAP